MYDNDKEMEKEVQDKYGTEMITKLANTNTEYTYLPTQSNTV
jgi:hypothetical protein